MGNDGYDEKTMVISLTIRSCIWPNLREYIERFKGNPHVVAPTKDDFLHALPNVRTTFPSPLPAYLSRNMKTFPEKEFHVDEHSSLSGLFSLGLKGVRRELRRSGERVKRLVLEIEDEILNWLEGGTIILPDTDDPSTLDFPGKPIGHSGKIMEIRRDPLRMVWCVENDGFARYIIHCCARYHGVVSFSQFQSLFRSLQPLIM